MKLGQLTYAGQTDDGSWNAKGKYAVQKPLTAEDPRKFLTLATQFMHKLNGESGKGCSGKT